MYCWSDSRVLFILKRSSYNYGSGYTVFESGLFNSVRFCSEELREAGIENKIVIVNDNNEIDREVRIYQPTHVIIEALWVIPEKFEVLREIYPQVQWIVRLHSEIPFLAADGQAMEWIFGYLDQLNVVVAGNNERLVDDLKSVVGHKGYKIIYLPNCYTEFPDDFKRHTRDEEVVNVGCFGAIRPLKNQLIQAISAIQFAREIDRELNFHVNTTRVEQAGASVLKNIVGLFNHVNPRRYRLIQHPWMSRHDFLNVFHRIDVGLQVSFTETFNIVTADMVSRGIPVVVSPEIPWVLPLYRANPTSTEDISDKLRVAWKLRHFYVQTINKHRLKAFASKSAGIWIRYFGGPKTW